MNTFIFRIILSLNLLMISCAKLPVKEQSRSKATEEQLSHEEKTERSKKQKLHFLKSVRSGTKGVRR